MFNYFLFGIFPYIAVILAAVVSIYRYRTNKYSYTTQSSQFLENKIMSVASISWHYGILIVLLAHIFAIAFPSAWAKIIQEPLRLYIVEITGFLLGLLALLGIVLFLYRRITNQRIRVITTKRDRLVGLLLLLQVLSGVMIACHYKFGAAWYLHTAVPWIWSLIKLNPQIEYITNLPHAVLFHFVNAFILIAILPFTKLVHIFTFPIAYLIRPPQIVIWNKQRKR